MLGLVGLRIFEATGSDIEGPARAALPHGGGAVARSSDMVHRRGVLDSGHDLGTLTHKDPTEERTPVNTRTIAIAALVIAVILVLILVL